MRGAIPALGKDLDLPLVGSKLKNGKEHESYYMIG